jgi:hypothetical protein
MYEETCIRGRRARIPWTCGHEAANNTQTLCLTTGPDSRKLCAWPRRENRKAAPLSGTARYLFRFPPLLLAQSLPRKGFFGPALLAGLHVEAMLLDLLDDVFLLHLALETPQGIFQGFVLLDDDFRHFMNSPPIRFGLEYLRSFLRDIPRPLYGSLGSAPVFDYRMCGPLRGPHPER